MNLAQQYCVGPATHVYAAYLPAAYHVASKYHACLGHQLNIKKQPYIAFSFQTTQEIATTSANLGNRDLLVGIWCLPAVFGRRDAAWRNRPSTLEGARLTITTLHRKGYGTHDCLITVGHLGNLPRSLIT